ncbi:hypothetical protein OSTOST_01759 [Ostertagia ostertagi]
MDIAALFVDIFNPLPAYPSRQRAVRMPHAPKRPCPLNRDEKILAVRNALRYIPKQHHGVLAKEFAEELEECGHIYAYRFMPNFHLKAEDQLPFSLVHVHPPPSLPPDRRRPSALMEGKLDELGCVGVGYVNQMW